MVKAHCGALRDVCREAEGQVHWQVFMSEVCVGDKFVGFVTLQREHTRITR